MAITLDATSAGSAGTAPSITWNHTCGAGAILTVNAIYSDTSSQTSSMTYNGVAMTRVGSVSIVGINSYSELYYLLTPAAGTHAIVYTVGGTTASINGGAMSYFGSDSGSIDTSTSGTGTGTGGGTVSVSMTTSVTGDWFVAIIADNGNGFSGQGSTTFRAYGGWDTNGSVGGAGLHSMSWNEIAGGGKNYAYVALALKPASATTLSVSDSTTTSESVQLLVLTVEPVVVSDSTTTSENVQLTLISPTSAFSEIMCNLVVSAYKGVTATLQAAQSTYAMRTFFNAKIIDDTVQPTQVISTNLPPLGNGSAATAPDGTIFAVGLDASRNVVLYKGANLHGGTWDSTLILEASGGTFDQPFNNYSIAISDYINGTYAILVSYYDNLVNSAVLVNSKGWISTNGGVSFISAGSQSMGVAGSAYFGAAFLNLSIAAMKPRLVHGAIAYGWVTLKPNLSTYFSVVEQGYDVGYAYGTVGGSFAGIFKWSSRYVNSSDWNVHSICTYFINGIDYVVFSGFRYFIESPNLTVRGSTGFYIPQWGIWVTNISQIEDNPNESDTSPVGDVWMNPKMVFNSIAIGNSNLNTFLYPQASVINGVVNLTFLAGVVNKVISSTAGSSLVHWTYMLMQSIDGETFTYPTPYVMTDGSEFASQTPANDFGASYVAQGNFRYLIGNQNVWEFMQNNIVADVTNDIIQYTITDTAGQPSSITLQLANQNNQWYPSGVNPGASAIAGNRKVVFQQGYYNANGIPETIPRNVYFIDDINVNVSNTNNDVTISGRDLYKQLKTLITRWAFNWFGPFFYTDNFDGTTLPNWSQQSGSWIETSNALTLPSTPGSDAIITLATIPRVTEASIMAVQISVNSGTTGNLYVYAYYIDANNWLRLNYNFAPTPDQSTIEKSVAGSVSVIQTVNNSYL